MGNVTSRTEAVWLDVLMFTRKRITRVLRLENAHSDLHLCCLIVTLTV